MKLRTNFVVLMLASVAFTACQSKSNNSTEEVAADSLLTTVPDNLMPDITLERTDGTKLQLSSLFGKTLFLDFWATWCPPCCAEIPHLEKLSEQLADNKDVRIISISVDQDRDAWVKKVTKDNPAWEQYRISSEDVDVFFSAIELETIPRFIIVGIDGSIINADAPRPSDENCEAAILQVLPSAL
jgi:thiol-disulfide isomerase/thioredoxin